LRRIVDRDLLDTAAARPGRFAVIVVRQSRCRNAACAIGAFQCFLD
jgi:hypothetical protein